MNTFYVWLFVHSTFSDSNKYWFSAICTHFTYLLMSHTSPPWAPPVMASTIASDTLAPVPIDGARWSGVVVSVNGGGRKGSEDKWDNRDDYDGGKSNGGGVSSDDNDDDWDNKGDDGSGGGGGESNNVGEGSAVVTQRQRPWRRRRWRLSQVPDRN